MMRADKQVPDSDGQVLTELVIDLETGLLSIRTAAIVVNQGSARCA